MVQDAPVDEGQRERQGAVWEGLEERLRRLGHAQSANLNQEQTRWYAQFLDANESGVALEMLVDWLSESEAAISDDDRREMIGLASGMGNEDRVSFAAAQAVSRAAR